MFSDAFYNCISSGCPSKIDWVQVVTHKLTWELLAARYRIQRQWNLHQSVQGAAHTIQWLGIHVWFWGSWFQYRSISRATRKEWFFSAKSAWSQWGWRAQPQPISSGKGARQQNALKRQFMHRKTSLKSLDLCQNQAEISWHSPRRVNHMKLFWLSKTTNSERDNVERDTVALQFSRSTRKRLQQIIKVVGTTSGGKVV